MNKLFSSFWKPSVLLAISITVYLSANAQNIQWGKNYGGSLYDQANDIKPTSDGGYILAGYSRSNNNDVSSNNGEEDVWILKVDSAGNIQWEKNFGGSERERASAVCQTLDGGYIVAGSSESNDFDVSGNNGSFDAWIVKVDGLGNMEWEQNYGGSNADNGNSIQQDAQGNYWVAASTSSSDFDVSGNYGGYDFWILKLDSSGNILWEKNYGGSSFDHPYSLQLTLDGGCVASGSSLSGNIDVDTNYGKNDYLVLKLDSIGTVEWAKSYGGSENDRAWSIRTTKTGGYIVGGQSGSNDNHVSGNYGDEDCWVLALDNMGNIEWEQNYGGSRDDVSYSTLQTSDGNFLISGYSRSEDSVVSANYGAADIWVVKIANGGNIIWEQNYGGTGSDVAYSMQETDTGIYILTGSSYSNDHDVLSNYGSSDFWLFALEDTSICFPTSSNIQPTSCNSYTSPSGNKVWMVGGAYFDTIPNTKGCDSIITINLTINNIDTSVAQKGPMLTANAAGATYQWISCDQGTPITGATNQTFTATSNGNYAVVVTGNGCTDTSSCFEVTSIGVHKNIPLEVKLHSNPSDGSMLIDLGRSYSFIEIITTNALGQRLKEVQLKNTAILQLSIAGPSGIYFIQIKTDDNQTATLKAVKF